MLAPDSGEIFKNRFYYIAILSMYCHVVSVSCKANGDRNQLGVTHKPINTLKYWQRLLSW